MRVDFIYASPVGVTCKETIQWLNGTEFHAENPVVVEKVQARGKRSTEISTEKQVALIGEPKTKIYRRTGGNTLVRIIRKQSFNQ